MTVLNKTALNRSTGRIRLAFFVLVLIAGTGGELVAGGANSAAYWIRTYGEVTPAADARVARAMKIFQAVLSVADIKSNRYPHLLVVNSPANPWAMAIPDGTVLLSRGALQTCYADVPPDVGDARLAFILGHELAHQGKDDFWHAAAFTALKKHKGNEQAALVALLQQTADVRGNKQKNQVTRTKELQADSYGLMYMSMAGYDPRYIFNYQGHSFFEQWVKQVTGNAAYSDPTHPNPRQRAEFLEAQLQPVRRELDLFSFSVRLYQAGRIEEALDGFDTFRQKYPGREVFSNLGLCHYQLAIRELAACGGSGYFDFAPATMIDTATRAEKLRGAPEDCLADPAVRQHLDEAIRYLEKAAAMDSRHLPSRLNLSSALIVGRQPTRAMAVAEEALKIMPGNTLALNNKAVALYLFGRIENIAMLDQAVGLLLPVAQMKENTPWQVLYNLASLLRLQGNDEDAARFRKQALLHHPDELYRGILEGSSGRGPQRSNPEVLVGSVPAAPVPPGPVSRETREELARMEAVPLVFAGLHGQVYRRDGLRVYVVDGFVEMVVSELVTPVAAKHIREQYGPPDRVFQTGRGQTWCYENYFVDICGGKAIRAVYIF